MATEISTGDIRDSGNLIDQFREYLNQPTGYTTTTGTNGTGTQWFIYEDGPDLDQGELVLKKTTIVPNPDLRFRDLFEPDPDDEVPMEKEEIVEEKVVLQKKMNWDEYPPMIVTPFTQEISTPSPNTMVNPLTRYGNGSGNDSGSTHWFSDQNSSSPEDSSTVYIRHSCGSSYAYLMDNDRWATPETIDRSTRSLGKS